ncbi:MAG: hypothetical protein H6745_08375 [Deltaproteobacteria bacterium]|nr:hypothetical protein [Deltaproteobacteria bacterium]
MIASPLALRAAVAALLALVAAAAAPGAARAQAIRLSAAVPWYARHETTPVVITAGGVDAQGVVVEARCGDDVGRATIDVSATTTTRTTVLVPASIGYLGSCSASVRWRDPGDVERVATAPFRGKEGASVIVVDPPADLDDTSEYRLAGVTIADLPDRWQGYPTSLALVVDGAAAARLSAAQREAIARFTVAGGRLFTSGDDASLRAAGALPTAHADDRQLAVRAALDDLDSRSQSDELPSLGVPGTNVVPVGGFLVLVLLFAVLAGPLNLWWVIKRRRRRALFLVTTPLLSFATCLLLIGFNLASEGLDAKRVATQLTWLDSARHEAFTWDALTLYTAFGESELRAPAEANVRATLETYDLSEGEYIDADVISAVDSGRRVTWSGAEQILGGGWVPARRSAHLVVATPRAERRRLLVHPAGSAGFELENGLDVALADITWIDGGGTEWVAAGAGPGERVPLTLYGPRRTRLAPSDVVRAGPGAERAWRRAQEPLHVRATLAAPLTPLPGPSAEDVEPTAAVLIGPLAPTTAEATP